MRRSSPPPFGFTLIELLVALAVSMLVVLAGAALLEAQTRNFRRTSDERTLQDTGRIALDAITTDLRLAGLGVDPGLVFDLGVVPAARVAASTSGATFTTTSLTCAGGAVACRDHVDGPDELVFLARDPAFGKSLVAAATAGSTSLTVEGPLNVALSAGQVLQVVCYTGDKMPWAYVQVSAAVAAQPAAASVVIPITGSGGSTFPTQNGLMADPCFQTVATLGVAATRPSAAKVFKVDRTRYFVQSYSAGGALVAWGTAGSRPWLMVDRGLGGTAAVAPDVEDLQVAYVFPNAPANQVVGATPGTPISNDEAGVNLSGTCPIYGDLPDAPSRVNHHPGNIRAVRLSLTVRSTEADAAIRGDPLGASLNRPALPGAPAGFRRLQLQTSVSLRNLDARAPYYPAYGDGTDQLNVGGG